MIRKNDSEHRDVKYWEWYGNIPFRMDSWRIEKQMDQLCAALKVVVDNLVASCTESTE